MSLKKKVAFVVAAMSLSLVFSGGPVAAQPHQAAASSEDLARQLIQLTGGGNLGKQVMAQMVDSFRKANPKIPDQFWTEFLASVNPKQIEDLVVPIYVKNLTPEEMRAAIQFYSSPAGQSLTRKLPVIVQQSMVVGQQWGQQLAADVAQRITKYKQTHPGT